MYTNKPMLSHLSHLSARRVVKKWPSFLKSKGVLACSRNPIKTVLNSNILEGPAHYDPHICFQVFIPLTLLAQCFIIS